MAMTHIDFSTSNDYGRKLRGMLNTCEAGDDQLADMRNMMSLMIAGDGSQDVHYAEMTRLFGFTNDATAKAAFLEIDSAYSKTSGDGAVSGVRSARDQLFNKLRG